MWKTKLGSLALVCMAVAIGWFVAGSQSEFQQAAQTYRLGWLFPTSTVQNLQSEYPFRLGLDLAGGSRLVFKADVSQVDPNEVGNAMESLRDVIERRVNILGVSEPVVTTERSFNGDEYRLVVELPGFTNLDDAARAIGETPLLEFKTVRPDGPEKDAIIQARQNLANLVVDEEGYINITPESQMDPDFVDTPLGGGQLSKATLQFDPTTRQPVIALQFNDEGAALFEKITEENIGKPVAIFLDGFPLSIPVVQQKISGGQAVITGEFSPQEARELVGRLNSGALPLKIELIGSQLVGATLGDDSVESGVRAVAIGFLVIAIFLVAWYRLPGLLAVIALATYVVIMLAFFKFIPVVITAAGIAGFIISMGLAVDANVLIFERMKEEMQNGKSVKDSVALGVSRAWSSIKDSNIASLISATILFWLGTSVVKGFALTLGLGVVVSLFTVLVVTRVFLLAVAGSQNGPLARFLFSNGLGTGKTIK